MKSQRTIAMAFLVAALLSSSMAQTAKKEPGAANGSAQHKIAITVDERVELLAVLQGLGKFAPQVGLVGSLDMPYRHDVRAYFSPYAEHPAVKCLDELAFKGFSFEAPHYLMVHLTGLSELEFRTPLSPELVKRAGGREQLESCVAQIRDFAQRSEFSNFYVAHRGFYEALAHKARAALADRDYLADIEAYMGLQQASYTIYLAPLLQGNFAPRVRTASGAFEVFSVNTPSGTENGIPTFSGESLRDTVWHEFGHSFINPLAETHREQLMALEASLFPPVQKQLRQRGYGNWITVVNEHVIRAITLRLHALAEGEESARSEQQREAAQGFAYLGPLVEELRKYEAERTAYPDIAKFYPRLVSRLAALPGNTPAGKTE